MNKSLSGSETREAEVILPLCFLFLKEIMKQDIKEAIRWMQIISDSIGWPGPLASISPSLNILNIIYEDALGLSASISIDVINQHISDL